VAKPDWEKISAWLDRAQAHGAERAVITGGGEPTLLAPDLLQQLVNTCANRFDRVVLITNGHNLVTASEGGKIARLGALYDAGLRVLAISRHHFDAERNEQLMRLHTPVELLTRTWRNNHHRWPELRLRFISVLQKGGIADDTAVENYLSWAINQGVEEICFKELYVSTSAESIYHDYSANDWSRRHQVPLSLITRFAEQRGFVVESHLPWGAPVGGLAFNTAGNLFVSDFQSGDIYKYTGGTQSVFASGLNGPSGLAFNSAGDLFVSDTSSGDILEYTPGGGQSTFATGLSFPEGLAFNSAGDLFVADSHSGNVYEYTPGGVQSTFASGLDYPFELAFAPVPEPSTLALLAAGASAMALRLRRKK
jgi:hypothetical protein